MLATRLRKFVALSRRERLLHLETAVWLICTKALLILLPFNRTRSVLIRFGEADRAGDSVNDMASVVEAIERISRFLAPAKINCLPQALVGHMLLHRKGFDVDLRIGVKKAENGKLHAHAWLEHQGRIILGDLPDLATFALLPPLKRTS